MQRIWQSLLLTVLLVVAFATPARPQSFTLAPFMSGQYFTASGTLAACASCEANFYLSGTSTRRDVYTDDDGTVAANPVVLDSAGRATIYLAVGVSYRVVLTSSGGGTTYWDVDPVTAIPSSAGNIDVTATAGEALSAGDVVYLSDGSGSLTAGRWYQADADNTYESSTAGLVGMATAAIASAGTGTVRIAGRVTGLSSLTTGEFYYASATAAALTATPPTNQRFIGIADSTTTLVLGRGDGAVRLPDSDGTHTLSLITTANLTEDRRLVINIGDANQQLTVNGASTINQNVSTTGDPEFNTVAISDSNDSHQLQITTSSDLTADRVLTIVTGDADRTLTLPVLTSPLNIVEGRLTLTSGTPVTTSDVTAATTVYWALYKGNRVALYTGTEWTVVTLSELSVAVPGTTTTMYDVFIDYNAGTPVLAVTAWTNDTTRATALTTQDGVEVQTGNLDWRYVGSFRTTGVSGQTEDSERVRLLWNMYNRVFRSWRRIDPTDSWTYTTATFRQANGSTSNQLEAVIGLREDAIRIELVAIAENSSANISRQIALDRDSTSSGGSGIAGSDGVSGSVSGAGESRAVRATLVEIPPLGYHYWAWQEQSTASGTTTWYGDGGATNRVAGLFGTIQN